MPVETALFLAPVALKPCVLVRADLLVLSAFFRGLVLAQFVFFVNLSTRAAPVRARPIAVFHGVCHRLWGFMPLLQISGTYNRAQNKREALPDEVVALVVSPLEPGEDGINIHCNLGEELREL